MKAQASLELLIIMAAALASLAIILPQVSQVMQKTSDETNWLLLSNQLHELAGKAETAKIMGNGFKTELNFIIPDNSTIKQNGNLLQASLGDKTEEIEIGEFQLNGFKTGETTATIENENGAVIITLN